MYNSGSIIERGKNRKKKNCISAKSMLVYMYQKFSAERALWGSLGNLPNVIKKT